MLTQRALLLGFVAFCFYLIAVVNELPGFYYVLMWLAVGLLAASLGIAFLSLSGLSFEWSLARSVGHAASLAAPTHDEVGARELSVPVVEATLINRGSLNKTGVLIELYLRDLDREDEAKLVYLLEAVPAGKTLDIALPLRELPRGRYKLERARLIGSDVLGLFRARRNLDLKADATEIKVAPALLPAASIALSRRGGRARRGSSLRARPGGGDELRGTRPYIVGDDMRQIHWKSTARTGELVMREWEQIGHAATLVVWDGARNTQWGVGPLDSIECGLIMAASLLDAYAARALPCALAVLGATACFCPHAPDQNAGKSTLGSAALEALARARAQRATPLQAALDGVWHDAREIESVILISASLAPDAIELVRSLRARNVEVRVLLIDGAALGRATGDARFVARRAQKNPPHQLGTNAASLPVTSAALARHKAALTGAGARVVLLSSDGAAEIWPALQQAQRELLDPVEPTATLMANATGPKKAGTEVRGRSRETDSAELSDESALQNL